MSFANWNFCCFQVQVRSQHCNSNTYPLYSSIMCAKGNVWLFLEKYSRARVTSCRYCISCHLIPRNPSGLNQAADLLPFFNMTKLSTTLSVWCESPVTKLKTSFSPEHLVSSSCVLVSVVFCLVAWVAQVVVPSALSAVGRFCVLFCYGEQRYTKPNLHQSCMCHKLQAKRI